MLKMKNSDRFLYCFNRIERYLISKQQNSKNHTPFSELVKLTAGVNAVIRRYRDDLLQFADLRNAIVHYRTDPNIVIAEPHENTVLKIEAIEKELTEPKLVLPLFQREVVTYKLSDTLSIMLKDIRERAYSQFPVYKGNHFSGLVTENGITNWLSQNVDEDVFSLRETTLNEILKYEENRDNHRFISRFLSIYEAEEIFKRSLLKGLRLDALLITQNGKNSEKLLGIITPWDIIEVPRI